MSAILDQHKAWVSRVIQRINPRHGMTPSPVHVTHDRHGLGPSYIATIHHPAHWSLHEAIEGLESTDDSQRHAVDRAHPEGQWISVRTDHDEDPHPLYVHPHMGAHVIAGGLAKRMDGLMIDGIMAHEKYVELSHRRRAHVRMQRRQLERQMMRAGRDVQPETVPLVQQELDMTPDQRAEYGRILHHYAVAKHKGPHGEGFKEAVGQFVSPMHLFPTDEMEGPHEALEGVHRNLDMHRDDALWKVQHLHPAAARTQWLGKFLYAHKSEPAVVAVQDRQAREMLAQRLAEMGEPVSLIHSSQDVSGLHEFAPPSGTPRSRVLVVPDMGIAPVNRTHHRIYFDHTPEETQHDSRYVLSAHTLSDRVG